MILLNWFWLFLVCGIFAVVRSQCKINEGRISDIQRLFVVNLGRLFKERKLLTDETVDSGKYLYMPCSDPTSSGIILREEMKVKCTGTSFELQSDVLPCIRGMNATTKVVSDSSCDKTMYRIGFAVRGTFLELFRSCYNVELTRPLFTKHIIKPFGRASSRPKKAFASHNIVKGELSFKNANIFDRLNEIFNNNQEYQKSKAVPLIDRGHLVPSGDFVRYHNQEATFALLNVAPQFKTINNGAWNSVENFVREEAVRRQRALTIYTGTSDDVVALTNKGSINNEKIEIYLWDDNGKNKNPVPKWFYKVIVDGNDKLVVVTSNNPFYKEEAPPSFCINKECPPEMTRKLRRDRRRNQKLENFGVTFCCESKEFAKHYLTKILKDNSNCLNCFKLNL